MTTEMEIIDIYVYTSQLKKLTLVYNSDSIVKIYMFEIQQVRSF